MPVAHNSSIFREISCSDLGEALKSDRALRALCNSTVTVRFSIEETSDDGTSAFGVIIQRGVIEVATGVVNDEEFALCANASVWAKFFQKVPELGYQSFWALYLPQNLVIPAVAQVRGDQDKFAQFAAIWRRSLEVMHELLNGPPVASPDPVEPDEDVIVGRYAYLDLPKWGGKCKVYYEQSGEGDQDILFLHTAGSDGRQYHGVMNDPRMLSSGIRMTIFDLPSHGRSFPPRDYFPGEHYNSEDRYIEIIAAIIAKLGLKKVIVCGASMAGLICIAVALRNHEVGAFATIPVQGTEFVDMHRMTWDKDPKINQSLLVPEFTYGMMAPQSPAANKRLVWHTYSAQAYMMYAGDLDFYFGGFDYRGRLGQIDTTKMKVAMLTGEYDWSCRPEMSIQTAKQIEGSWIQIMPGLGHFPATENPEVFTTHLLEAIEFVNK